ncbi:fluoride efflux transporter FluC [Falsarthrobacter nasiphocae]|uniref:Fluoride-specific ion channel n=1 Tax=Falsarthrobacter nasiphocae TaxID=189863 RepID=A0AAE3YIE0_9MICC|nr:CrcB family protein [Falsarthrobacter nasiphocae]MDR6892729.1 CrcB protein [Falsarthrobacter nasiphocae]
MTPGGSAVLVAAAVAAAGGIGSVARYLLDTSSPASAQGNWWARQPRGLWAANLLACLVIGAAAAVRAPSWHLVLATGLAGGLSTWSSWIVGARSRWAAARDLDAVTRRSERRSALVQVLGQAAGGLACAGLGLALGRLVLV